MLSTSDIANFHRKFGLPYEGDPRELPEEMSAFRIKFMQEELLEYIEAIAERRLEGQLDALVDLVYVAIGTAYLQGFDFDEAWRRVHAANMAKVRATSPDESKRGSALDIVKPAGWKAPDLSDLVEPYTGHKPSKPATPLADIDFAEVELRVTTAVVEAAVSKADSVTLLKELAKRGGHPGALADAALLCVKKTQDYNRDQERVDIHTVDRSNYFPFGAVSYAQMLHTKAQRFNSLVLAKQQGSPVNFEGLRDTALDIINYAGFFAADKKAAA